MGTFVLSFLVLALAVAGMSVGVLFGRAPIRGSCGGLGNGGSCSSCSRPCASERRRRALAARDDQPG